MSWVTTAWQPPRGPLPVRVPWPSRAAPKTSIGSSRTPCSPRSRHPPRRRAANAPPRRPRRGARPEARGSIHCKCSPPAPSPPPLPRWSPARGRRSRPRDWDDHHPPPTTRLARAASAPGATPSSIRRPRLRWRPSMPCAPTCRGPRTASGILRPPTHVPRPHPPGPPVPVKEGPPPPPSGLPPRPPRAAPHRRPRWPRGTTLRARRRPRRRRRRGRW